jgi:hypothetical protein
MIFMAFLQPCLAEPDSVIAGNFNVSFDLGLPHNAYNIDIGEPEQWEGIWAEYIAILDNTLRYRIVAIAINEGEVGTWEEMAAAIQPCLISNDFRNVESSKMIIDGKDGIIVAGDSYELGIKIKTYFALYYINNYTSISIISGYPWDEGTLQFLKTIHIEKMNATA